MQFQISIENIKFARNDHNPLNIDSLLVLDNVIIIRSPKSCHDRPFCTLYLRPRVRIRTPILHQRSAYVYHYYVLISMVNEQLFIQHETEFTDKYIINLYIGQIESSRWGVVLEPIRGPKRVIVCELLTTLHLSKSTKRRLCCPISSNSLGKLNEAAGRFNKSMK